MSENVKKLIDLRVKLQLAEKRYEEASDEKEVEQLEQEITDTRKEIEETEALIKAEEKQEENKEETPAEPTAEEVQRSDKWTKVETKNLKQVYSTKEEERGKKIMNTNLEQRKAFMNAVYSGDFSKIEKRDVTSTGDVAYVIPENLVNDIIVELKETGYILSKCYQTSYAVGQTIPVGLIKIKASWVGKKDKEASQLERSGEGLGSTVQKGGVESTVVFFNYKLRCEVALTYETQIQSLEIFEKKFVQQVVEAMAEELEAAVINGDGINQPTGILKETPRTGKAITIASGEKITYEKMIDFVGAVPKKYRKGAVAFMTQNTFNKFMSVVDENGQPVAKVTAGVDGDFEYRLFGMPVELADEYLEDYALTVEEDKLFAFIYNFKEYVLNTNYNLGMKSKEDWDTEDKHYKAVMAADGKAVTKYSLVTFTVVKPSA